MTESVSNILQAMFRSCTDNIAYRNPVCPGIKHNLLKIFYKYNINILQ